MVKKLDRLQHKILISYFDIKDGPKILIDDLSKVNNKVNIKLPEPTIARLLDAYHGKKFHFYNDNSVLSFHYHFSIRDSGTATGTHELLTSVVFKKPNSLSEESYYTNVIRSKKKYRRWLTIISKAVRENEMVNNLLRTKRTRFLSDKVISSEVKNSLMKSLILKTRGETNNAPEVSLQF
jgi:hypothetical protein